MDRVQASTQLQHMEEERIGMMNVLLSKYDSNLSVFAPRLSQVLMAYMFFTCISVFFSLCVFFVSCHICTLFFVCVCIYLSIILSIYVFCIYCIYVCFWDIYMS